MIIINQRLPITTHKLRINSKSTIYRKAIAQFIIAARLIAIECTAEHGGKLMAVFLFVSCMKIKMARLLTGSFAVIAITPDK